MTDFSRRTLLIALPAGALAACETLDPAVIDGLIGGAGALSQGEAAAGIRAALNNGIGHAISNVGVLDGFFGNPQIRIPLPNALKDVQSVLSPLGAGGLLSDLERQLNRGAEAAAPVARDIFVDAVSGLSINDAINIVRGPDNAATQYLQSRTSDRLTQLFSPIMENALADTGALRLVDQISSSVGPLASQVLGGDPKGNLVRHGVDYGLDGLFYYIAEEEKLIRENPAKRTSDILRRVFGSV